ncbi:hypothetical protein DFH06DRAFT_1336484 [Mycena polygramma]|nr:hypothetical protein DFH06DRAFT_1336484 [Mycena polygramma]
MVLGLDPAFPEDIERHITELLLDNVGDMWRVMSCVAFRFRVWTKPTMFRTLFLRNANFIQILAIDLPSTRGNLSDAGLTQISQLLQASEGVRHLAVSWHIWEHFASECGRLKIGSVYLIWDGTHDLSEPPLDKIQHPLSLTEFTMYAPPANTTRVDWFYFPVTITEDFPNLVRLTYAVSEQPDIHGYGEYLEGVMWVLVDRPTKRLDSSTTEFIWQLKVEYLNYFTAYLRCPNQVLGEWLAKMEGRRSVLEHPPPRDPDQPYPPTNGDIMDW